MTSPPKLPLGATVQEGSYAQCFSGQIRQSIAVSTPQKWRMPIMSINGDVFQGSRCSGVRSYGGPRRSLPAAEAAAGCPYRKSNPHVSMVQTSEVWGGHD